MSRGPVTRALASFAAVLAAACTIEERVDRVRPDPDGPPSSEFVRPWGDELPPVAVLSGDLLWIWQMVGTVPGSVPPRLVEGGVVPETRQALDNVQDVLDAVAAGPEDVAQCSAWVVDRADVDDVLAVYARRFPGPPTRVGVVVGSLPLDARVQLECTAVMPTSP